MFIGMVAIMRNSVVFGKRASMRVIASGQRRLFMAAGLGNFSGMVPG
jgi:hypothetical protein